MAGEKKNVFAALVDVDEGRLSKETVCIANLAVRVGMWWASQPFLCQVSENQALLYFDGRDRMWHCNIEGGALSMRKLKTQMPAKRSFSATPICLPDGKLLVAGADPESKDIALISCCEEVQFERVGSIPGMARYWASFVLIGGRFVVGLGG